jgi:nicotinamide-nucleotide amidase
VVVEVIRWIIRKALWGKTSLANWAPFVESLFYNASMQAIILSVGDELVLGQTVDTNSAFLSAQLARHGISTVYHCTVADDQASIAESIRSAAGRADVIIVTGGLGPTEDDLTRQGLADALDVALVEDPASIDQLNAFFAGRGKTPSPNNMVQALHPQGSTMIENTCGTAPGIKAQLAGSAIYVTPGVPSEMRAMFELSIGPRLWADPATSSANPTGKPAAGRFIRSAKVNTFGLGESLAAQRLGSLMARGRNPQVGTTVTDGVISVRIRSEGDDESSVEQALNDTLAQVETLLGPLCFGRDEQTLQDDLVHKLREHKLTLATAESCTGGLIGKRVTEVSGSSEIYLGGWITYSNQMKIAQLGVPEALIAEHGAVSQEVARAMASGTLTHSGADLAVGITGIAGPGGGTAQKPVGTVWLGLAWQEAGRPGAGRAEAGANTEAVLLQLSGDRSTVRDRATKHALQRLRFHLLGISMNSILQTMSDPPSS